MTLSQGEVSFNFMADLGTPRLINLYLHLNDVQFPHAVTTTLSDQASERCVLGHKDLMKPTSSKLTLLCFPCSLSSGPDTVSSFRLLTDPPSLSSPYPQMLRTLFLYSKEELKVKTRKPP